MKKIIAIALIGMLALPIFAQDKPDRSEEKNVIKLNTLSLIIGNYSPTPKLGYFSFYFQIG